MHGEENYTLRYIATERIDGGGNDVCMFETYVLSPSPLPSRSPPRPRGFPPFASLQQADAE